MAKAAGLALGAALFAAGWAAPAAAGEIVKLREGAAADLFPIAQQISDPPNASPLSLAPAPRRTLQLDSKGRWGFRLDLDQPAARDQDLRDVQAGAYLRIGKGLRVGGTVGFGSATTPQNLRPADPAPRVRLETNFKF